MAASPWALPPGGGYVGDQRRGDTTPSPPPPPPCHRGRKEKRGRSDRPLGKALSRSRGAATGGWAPWGSAVGLRAAPGSSEDSGKRWPSPRPPARAAGLIPAGAPQGAADGGEMRQRGAPGRDAGPDPPPRLRRTRRRFWGGIFCAPTAEGLLMPVLFPWQLQIPGKYRKTQQPAFNQQEVTELLPQGGDGGVTVILIFLSFFFFFADRSLPSPPWHG